MYKILVIEDDKEINNLLCEGLKYEQYEICQAFDGEQAIENYSEDINLIILDLMLPKIDGIEVMRRIRDKSNVPIIILSAKDDECDRIVGLSMGADDYLGSDNTVMVHIKRLRNKIEDDSNSPKYIVTVWGIGYKLGE